MLMAARYELKSSDFMFFPEQWQDLICPSDKGMGV